MSVFTQVSHAQLHAYLTHYDVGELIGFQGIGEGVENTNYFVDTERGRWVLTLFERLNADDLPFFLGLLGHLASRGYPSAQPLADHSGATLRSLNCKPSALVTRLVGQSVLFPTLTQCAAVGQALGELHVLGESYTGRCVNSRGVEWRRTTAETLLPKVDADTRTLIAEELAAQSELDFGQLPQGVIHADLFKDNVLFVDERLTGVIDFYYACNDALLYDLAVALNDWCARPDGSLDLDAAAALLAAYRACREPNQAERGAWRLVLRAAAFRFFLSRLYDWTFPRAGDLVHIKDPAPYRHILLHHREQEPPAL